MNNKYLGHLIFIFLKFNLKHFLFLVSLNILVNKIILE